LITTAHYPAMAALPAILLFSPPTTAQNREAWRRRLTELESQGLKISHCTDLPQLYGSVRRHAETGASVAAVLASACADNCAAAAHLRALYPGLGIVMLTETSTESMALQALQSGVDTYCPIEASPQLLAAILFRLLWRLDVTAAARAAAAPRLVWVLAEQAWILCSPCGKRIPLTTAERAFLMALVNAPNQRAAHADLIQAVGQAHALDTVVGQQGRLSVLVSRLRRKCTEQDVALPLKSVHNWGYMFTGAL